jgi:hypothetical protein
MTEEEAKSKVCPILAGGNGVAHCIGKKCMAWRWDSIPNPDHNPFNGMQMWPAVPASIHSTTDGHCGLAHG